MTAPTLSPAVFDLSISATEREWLSEAFGHLYTHFWREPGDARIWGGNGVVRAECPSEAACDAMCGAAVRLFSSAELAAE